MRRKLWFVLCALLKQALQLSTRVVDGRFLVSDFSVDVPLHNREPWILVDTQPVFLANVGGFYIIQITGHL